VLVGKQKHMLGIETRKGGPGLSVLLDESCMLVHFVPNPSMSLSLPH